MEASGANAALPVNLPKSIEAERFCSLKNTTARIRGPVIALAHRAHGITEATNGTS